MIRVGVVGAGNMGKNHLRIYADMKDVELVGIVDKDRALAKRSAQKYNTECYTDFRKLLGKADAVSIAVPTEYHYPIAKTFLEEETDVLLEKPITKTLKEAGEIASAAEKKRRVLLVGHVERFNPAVEEIMKIVEHPLFIEARRIGPYDARIKEGVILDLMTHDIDILLSMIKEKIRDMNCLAGGGKNEDIAVAQIFFQNGMLATLTASRRGQTKIRKLNVTQLDSYMTLDYMGQNINIYRKTHAHYLSGKKMRYRQESMKEIPYIERREPLLLEIEHFLDCVRNRKEPKVGGRDAQKVLEVALNLKKRAYRKRKEV